ncbi:patatin-like phospholipase family protein [Massilia agilis]|uniref:Patatin-like phospholipase family protein n=1 Tax=Massilia agilis TaxID=1811226 RepID=A0ABT2DGF8_9BURK|nr:patatin-like phospholipase family protein [Massilia agilis]MCS0809508.1 patatin-like phospholipase family protein [Massilia agilis]
MPYIDYTSLTPDQVADVRRKLESAGIEVPPAAHTLAELAGAIDAFREREGIVADGALDQVTWRRLNALAGSVFAEVLQNELDLLRPRPDGSAGPDQVLPASRAELLRRAHAAGLTGLALSGGGVRSATFNLGVLQALGEQQLLRDFDYLSTVSGGGFIGGWLSKCIRERHGDVRAVEAMLTPGAAGEPVDSEAVEIQFLRQYSNYLSPRSGVFSADAWTLIGTYVRNTGLNLAMLLAWLCALLLLPRFAVWAVNRIVGKDAPWADWSDPAWMLGTASFLIAVFCIALSISSKPEASRGQRWFPVNQGAVLWFINFPLLLSGFLVSIGLWRHGGVMPSMLHAALSGRYEWRMGWVLVPGLVYFIVWACGWYLAHDRTSPYRRSGYAVCAAFFAGVLALMLAGTLEFAPGLVEHAVAHDTALRVARCWVPGLAGAFLLLAVGLAVPPLKRRQRVRRDVSRTDVHEGLSHFLSAMFALTIGTLLLLLGLSWLPNPAEHPILNNAVALTTFGMPLMMTLFSVTMTLMIGLIGTLYSDASREWWSRQGAWTSIFTIAWLMMFCAAFFLPPLLHWAWITYDPLANAGTAIGWLAMTWLGVKAGSGGTTTLFGVRFNRLELLARLAPYVFTLGIFAVLATLVQAAVAPPDLRCDSPTLACVYASHANASLATSGATLATAFSLCLGAALLLGWRVDINKFSLYMLYRNRLVRAYFGASNAHRKPHPFTGFDPDDDPQLADLQDQLPYHIVNTSLNLVRGEELAWQTRKAASFAFTPRFCGFETPLMPAQGANCAQHDAQRGTYRPTRQYASRAGKGVDDDAKVRLGMAVALSGAAASPNMGAHSSPPLNFLMTMFNVRLGRWCPNPRKAVWKRSSPPIGLFSLIAELFGMTNADANYVYLSDGGHFENLGIYELVRRRCRLIVAVDVASDRELAFEDLGNAIRKCATDLHVAIELDVSRMELVKGTDLAGASCAAGTIRYSHVDAEGVDGTLLYIKPAIVGDENADVINYRKAHPDYPHQSTADQWFDEAQFESYRALGYHIARHALARAAEVSKVPGQRRDVGKLCEELMKQHTGPVRADAAPASVHG